MPSIISAGTTAATAVSISGDTSGNLVFQSNGTTTALTINTSQQIQVNTGGSASAPVISKSDDTNTGLFFPTADTVAFAEGGTESMRLDSSGNLLIGQTTSAGNVTSTTGLYVGSISANPNLNTSSGSANTVWSTPSGLFFRSTSSIRYKRNVEDAKYGLKQVLLLRPVTYKGISKVDGENVFGGFIAEEVDAIGLKEFVVYDEENKPDSLGYDRMVSLLTKAIQEQHEIIKQLQADVEALKGVK